MTPRWKKCQLGDAVTLQRGFDLPERLRVAGSVPIVSSSGVTGYHNESKVAGPGVVTGRYGTLGEIHYVEQDYWPLNTTLFVKDFKGNHPRFISFLLGTLQFESKNVAGAVPGVNRNHLHMLEILLPDPDLQKKIASVLSAYDDLIANNTRRLAVLEEMAQSLYREWFVHLRYPGHEQTPIIETPQGRVPEGWSRVTVGDYVEKGLVELQTGPFGTQLKAADYTASGTPVINVRNIGYGDIRPDKLEHVPETVVARLGVHILKTGDIVFGRKGAVDRHILVTPAENQWMQGSDCIRLRCVPDQVCPFFLSFAFREEQHHQWMLLHCSNMTTMASLNQEVIGRIPLVTPSEPVSRMFREFSSCVIHQIGTLKRQADNARKTRDLLLPKLISGELDVERLDIDTGDPMDEVTT